MRRLLIIALLLLAPTPLFAATILITGTGDSLNTFRTNSNTNFTNINADVTGGAYSFSTTSANWWSALGLGFSTTSTNYWETLQPSRGFSTTSAAYWVTSTTSLPSITTLANLGTVKTSLSGLLYGNSGALAAVATGTISASGPLSVTAGRYAVGGSAAFSITQSGIGTDGYLSTTDWNLFNNKIGSSSLSGSAPITYNSSTGVIACPTCTVNGSSFPFTSTTNYGALANATGTPIWFQAGLQASSTSRFNSVDINGTSGAFKIDGNTVLQASSTTGSVGLGQGVGGFANVNNTSATYDVFLGYHAGVNVTNGASNILIGGVSTDANENLTSGSGNIKLGFNNSLPSATANNQLNIGNLIYGTNLDGSAKTYSTGQIGIGSTSPYARFSIQANNGDTNKILFAIGSSTQTATTTLFTVSNTGTTTIANGVSISAGCFFYNGACLTQGGAGTVTAVSVASANGFAGSSSGGATPALTLSTSITGLLKGDGTALSAAAYSDFPSMAANTVLANKTGASVAPTALATSSLFAAGTAGNVLTYTSAGTWIPSATTTFNSPLTYASGAVSCASCLTANQSITLSGAVTGSGATAITTSFGNISQGVLANTGAASAAPAATATSSLFTLGSGLTQSSTLLQQKENKSVTLLATTTSIQGTTTISLEVGYGEVWNTAKCFTDTGTMNVDFYHASSHLLPYINASTTIGTNTFTTNNTITAGDTVKVDIGTPASSPTKITCTVNDTI